MSELRRRLSAGDGQRVRLELVRDGGSLSVDLVLRRRV